MNNIKNFLINMILCLSSIIILLFFLEVFLRFTPYRNLIYSGTEKLKFLKGYFKLDNKAGFDIKENVPKRLFKFEDSSFYIWSNNIGCFDKNYYKKKDYILLLGDSFTWGYTSFPDTYGSIIEKYTKIRVLKCGVPSYGTKQELIKAKKIIHLVKKKPNIIIVGYYIKNDVINDFLFPQLTVINDYLISNRYFEDFSKGKIGYISFERLKEYIKNYETYGLKYKPKIPLLQKIKYWFKKHSILYNMLCICQKRKKLYNIQKLVWIKENYEYKWMKIAWKKHLQNLFKFKKLSDNINAKLVIVLIPSKEYVYPETRISNLQLDYNKPYNRVKKFLEEKNIFYIDLLPIFKKCSKKINLFWKINGHWNSNGNKLAGLIISKYLILNNMLNFKQKDILLTHIESELNKICRGVK